MRFVTVLKSAILFGFRPSADENKRQTPAWSKSRCVLGHTTSQCGAVHEDSQCRHERPSESPQSPATTHSPQKPPHRMDFFDAMVQIIPPLTAAPTSGTQESPRLEDPGIVSSRV